MNWSGVGQLVVVAVKNGGYEMFFKKRENDGGEKQIVMTLSESRIRGENAFGQKMMVT